MSIYITPITFSVTIVCFAIAIFKFQFLGVAPIALQKVVDRITDSYIVLDEEGTIIDFNETFLELFNLIPEDIRSRNFLGFLGMMKIDKNVIDKIGNAIEKVSKNDEVISSEEYIKKLNKYFKIEITSIKTESTILGTLILLKDITQHKEDMKTIKNNQDLLIERERLASLGQLIGGIAHNLKTPIMSIAGATEGLEDLIKEYDKSIDNPLVNSQDHHDIAREMESWIPKIRAHIEYMSDIITTVKGQAVALSNKEDISFTISELVKRVVY